MLKARLIIFLLKVFSPIKTTQHKIKIQLKNINNLSHNLVTFKINSQKSEVQQKYKQLKIKRMLFNMKT